MEILSDRFDPRPMPEDIDEQSAKPHGSTHLKLLFEKNSIERVREEFSPDSIVFLADGRPLVELDCALFDRTLHYLLSFGTKLELIEPAEVRAWFTNQAKEILHIYQ